MVLTKAELLASLQNEVRILLHLCTKVDRGRLDHRPTPKQRSTLELLQYLSFAGPRMLQAIRDGGFDQDAWMAAKEAAEGHDFDQTVDAIAAMADSFAHLLSEFEEEDFREEMEMFGRTATKGVFLVNSVLGNLTAYRMQFFLYLKSSGREELNTMNLWRGVDPPAE